MNFGFHPSQVLAKSFTKPVFAIDVGGVLASKQHDGEPMPMAQNGVMEIMARGFDPWIVSQCGRNRALMTEAWLEEHGFDFLIPMNNRIYIPFNEKKNTVLRALKAHSLVDDRHKHIEPAIDLKCLQRIYFFGAADTGQVGRVVAVPDWEALIRELDK